MGAGGGGRSGGGGRGGVQGRAKHERGKGQPRRDPFGVLFDLREAAAAAAVTANKGERGPQGQGLRRSKTSRCSSTAVAAVPK